MNLMKRAQSICGKSSRYLSDSTQSSVKEFSAPKTSLRVPIKISPRFERLERDHPFVKKLFRPYIAADFESQGVDQNGNPLKPLVSQKELKKLRQTAYLFGLDPSDDLNLPAPKEKKKIKVLDKRMETELARIAAIKAEKKERKMEQLEKKRIRQLQKGEITWDDIEREDKEMEDEEMVDDIKALPLRLRSREYRENYEKNKLEFIQTMMRDMDKKLEEMKQRRRELRKSKKPKTL